MEDERKEFESFIVQEAKSQGKDPKQYAQELGEEGLKKAYKRFQEQKKKKALKALHGAKLQYFKSLKNKCAEDEEVYYYKIGGSIGCGCKKKKGGEIEKEQKGGSVVDRFKRKVKEEKWDDKKDNKLDSLSLEEAKKTITPQGKKDLKNLREKFKKSTNKKDYEVEEGKCGGKVKKHQEGGKTVWRFKKPEMMGTSGEHLFVLSDPDKFGRTVIFGRSVIPRYDGTLQNDTSYQATVVNPRQFPDEGYFYLEHANLLAEKSPREVMNKPFDTWGEYFKHLLLKRNSLKRFIVKQPRQ